MLPQYGACVKLKPAGYEIRILDCGADLEQFLQKNADAYILVCGAKPWEWETSMEAVKQCCQMPGMVILYDQFCSSLLFYPKWPAGHTSGLRMPYFVDPFAGTRQADRVYRTVWKRWFGRQGGEKTRNLFSEERKQLR